MLLAVTHTAGPAIWFFVGLLAAIGILAMISPKRFSNLANCGGSWVDSTKFLAILDKRIDIDKRVLPFSRVLGFAVFASAILIAVLMRK